jgi:hypothetical protein
MYREIFDLPERLTRRGTPLADIVRYHVKRETGSERPEDVENERKWIDYHVAELARGRSFSDTRHLKKRPNHPRHQSADAGRRLG